MARRATPVLFIFLDLMQLCNFATCFISVQAVVWLVVRRRYMCIAFVFIMIPFLCQICRAGRASTLLPNSLRSAPTSPPVVLLPRSRANPATKADAWRVPLWWDLSSNEVLGHITNSFLRSFCELCSIEVSSCSPLITGDSSSSLFVLHHCSRIFFQNSDLLRK